MNRRPFLLPPIGLLAFLLTWSLVGGGWLRKASAEPVRDKHVEAELISGEAAIFPGQRFSVGLRLVADEPWHTYWINPASPGYVTSLKLDLPPGFKAGPLQFPYPHRFTTKNYSGGEDYTGYGYEGEAILIVEVTAPENLQPGTEVTLKGVADWLMCDPSSCIPGNADLQLTLAVVEAASSAPPGKQGSAMGTARDKLPRQPGWSVDVTYEGEEVVLKIAVPDEFEIPASDGGGRPNDVHAYPLRHDGLTSISFDAEAVIKPGGAQQFSVSEGVLTIRAAKSPNAPATLPDPFEVVIVSEAGFGDPALGHALHLSSGVLETASMGDSTGPADAAGQVETADQAEGAAGGEGWGFWLQRPFIVMLLATLMLGLALSLFGVFEVGVGLTGAGGKLANSSGLAGSFFSGALATVLATPCTAPFMGPAIAFALGQPGYVTMAVFTALGFGMVLPYLLLSIFPKAVQKLPRPGPWMETFKQAMGFPMLAVVAWLLWVLTFQIDSNGLLWVFAALILVSLAGWWYGRFGVVSSGKSLTARWVAKLAALGLVVAALLVMNHASDLRRPLESQDVEAQIAALQEDGQGVFVDFTAAWCVTCQSNKAVMHSDEVTKGLEASNTAFLEVDFTQKDPAILEVIKKYGGGGVPFYLLFSPDAEEEPIELGPLFTSSRGILDALEDRDAAKASADQRKELTLLPALIAAVFGGLILNLMPCVFPVISLKIMGFVSQAAEDRRTIFRHGIAFAAGAMLFFWILAGSLVLLRSSIAG